LTSIYFLTLAHLFLVRFLNIEKKKSPNKRTNINLLLPTAGSAREGQFRYQHSNKAKGTKRNKTDYSRFKSDLFIFVVAVVVAVAVAVVVFVV